MNKLNYGLLSNFISEQVVMPFYGKRLESISDLQLHPMLRAKNPYLFRAKNVRNGGELIKGVMDASISSGEETLFGTYLEQLAIYVCEMVYKGRKSSTTGLDLEFEKDNVYYIVNIKSGPNWGNSSQIEKMLIDFRKARSTLRTNSKAKEVVAVNGCCYGIDNNPEKLEHTKLCGERFWEFISGDKDLYLKIIEPLGEEAKEKDEQFVEIYNKKLNQLTKEFLTEFCKDGAIDWNKLVKYNSGAT